jgi:hypothetical protein
VHTVAAGPKPPCDYYPPDGEVCPDGMVDCWVLGELMCIDPAQFERCCEVIAT